jgi:hypothetical protein
MRPAPVTPKNIPVAVYPGIIEKGIKKSSSMPPIVVKK